MTAADRLDAFRQAHDPTLNIGEQGTHFEPKFNRDARRFIITAAQNATPVHSEWWTVLRAMAVHKQAEIVVIPLRYKNPTSQWTGSQKNEEYWAEEVEPFLCNRRVPLNPNLTLLGDIKIQPTAVRPLTGAEGLSHSSSGIIGATKLQLRTVATPNTRMAKVLTTTGACTVENYTDSRNGKIGEFHHSYSAIVVELAENGTHFYMRQLHYSRTTKSCTDVDVRYTYHAPDDVEAEFAPPALAVALGDTHVDFVDPKVEAATWDENTGLIAAVRPLHVIVHDLLDSYSCSPHHKDNPFIAAVKHSSRRDDVRAEVSRASDYVIDRARQTQAKTIVVPSNHNDMLVRYMKRADWRSDPANAEFYLETALAMVRKARMGNGGAEYPDPFTMWLRKAVKRVGMNDVIRVLDKDESFVLADVELGMHGDVGPNGARGSAMNLRRIGMRSIIGHSHSPCIEEGCYQTGTSTYLRLEYNHGPSGWLNCHCLLHADGKRQLIIIVDGKWRD